MPDSILINCNTHTTVEYGSVPVPAAASYLRNAGCTIWQPMKRVFIPRNKRKPNHEHITHDMIQRMPGYIFVECGDIGAIIREIYERGKMQSIVGIPGTSKIAVFSEQWINDLRDYYFHLNRAEDGKKHQKPKLQYKVGDIINVLRDDFTGLEFTIEGIKDDSVQVQLGLLKMTVPADQIRKAG